jgi:hypothetical protein
MQAISLASGPQYQTVTFAPGTRQLYDAGLGGGIGFMNGSGCIVGNTNVGGVGYYAVLTADHVISTAGQGAAVRNKIGMALGNSPDAGAAATGNSAWTQAATWYRGGSTGSKDMALMNVPYGAYNAANNANVVSLTPAYHLDGSGNPVLDITNFSDIGYGNEGRIDLVNSRYNPQGKYGTQRFITDQLSGIGLYNSPGGYSYLAVQFTIKNPKPVGNAGTGAGHDADSGSPMFRPVLWV